MWLMIAEKIYLSFSSSGRSVLVVLCLIWLAYPCLRTIRNAQFWHEKHCNQLPVVLSP
jgi:hypothetical protein